MISIRVDGNERRALVVRAKQEGRSLSNLIRHLVRVGLGTL